MADRRVDRAERCLRAMGGRARFQELLERIRTEEGNPDLSYQTVYIAIQLENQRLDQLGERTRFVTSKEGEGWGWVRLREESEFPKDSPARDLEVRIREANERVSDDIRKWLEQMDWRTFESTFLIKVLEALGFQDAQPTRPTRDGGVDARVTYKRGIIEARAVVSAKRWKGTVPVEDVRALRGLEGDEDTAIVVTTGKFSQDAKEVAGRSQNMRAVYLIDGEMLIDVCKRYQIGVKKVELPPLLVLDIDPELTREPGTGERAEEDGSEGTAPDTSAVRRLRDEMLGDRERGLSAEEVADLSGRALSTVRAYLGDPRKKAELARRIRSDAQVRARALQIVSRRREPKERE